MDIPHIPAAIVLQAVHEVYTPDKAPEWISEWHDARGAMGRAYPIEAVPAVLRLQARHAMEMQVMAMAYYRRVIADEARGMPRTTCGTTLPNSTAPLSLQAMEDASR